MGKKLFTATLVALALSLATSLVTPEQAQAKPGGGFSYGPRRTAPQNRVYKVYYYNVKGGREAHLYGSYTNYAAALKAMRYLNSYPEYRAYLR
jgi:hypothetical protein